MIAEIIEAEPEEITPDADLVSEFGVDSMMALEILASLEKKYKIIIPEEELPNMTTMRKILEVTKKYIEEKEE
ncbi:MAG: acyl carrier protein [Nitrospirae bacterium]|nr:MAG: acyl carrier protein [Nitrospirota bacterium]